MPELTLSVQAELLYRPHAYAATADALCLVCGGREAALLDTCPGARLSAAQHEWNYRAFVARVTSARRRGRRVC
jgi:hypothetical protein